MGYNTGEVSTHMLSDRSQTQKTIYFRVLLA